MKKSVISFIHSLAVLSVILFSSCEIGMGVAVDLEAPELTIEKPAKNNAFVPRTFSIEGTATDNVGCEKVTFEYKYTSNGVEYSDTKECPVQDGRFSCSFTFDKDVEVSFEITAHDKNNNGSEKSSASRTFIIDSNDPKIGKVAVRRGNYIARLLPLADFTTEYTGKTALRGYPENKDYFQKKNAVFMAKKGMGYIVEDAKSVNSAVRMKKLYSFLNTYIKNEDSMKKNMAELDFENSANRLADDIEKILKSGKK